MKALKAPSVEAPRWSEVTTAQHNKRLFNSLSFYLKETNKKFHLDVKVRKKWVDEVSCDVPVSPSACRDLVLFW